MLSSQFQHYDYHYQHFELSQLRRLACYSIERLMHPGFGPGPTITTVYV